LSAAALTPAGGIYRIPALLRRRPADTLCPSRFARKNLLILSELQSSGTHTGANTMYAVFRSGGKQYRAAKGDVLRLEKIDAEEGASLEFDQVLLVGNGSDLTVGSPLIEGTSVSATVLRQGKSRKVPVVKFRRRQNYLRQGTHRQFFTEVEITAIGGVSDSGASEVGEAKAPAKKKAAKKSAKKAGKKAAGKKPGTKKKSASKSAGKKSASKKADS
jgi:large subunit ribosomal protein L21